MRAIWSLSWQPPDGSFRVTRGPLRQRGFVNYKHIVPGLWYPGAATRYCATTYRWFRDILGDKECADAKALGVDAYVLLDRLAEQAPAGSADMMFLPFLGGVNDAPAAGLPSLACGQTTINRILPERHSKASDIP